MQTNEVTLGALERRIDMAVSLADIEQGVAERLKRVARTAKMPGFRPGKVPMRMVEQNYGAQVRSEIIGEAVERKFNETIREQKLRVAGYPSIEPKEGSAEGSLEFSATFEIMPASGASAPPLIASTPTRLTISWAASLEVARFTSVLPSVVCLVMSMPPMFTVPATWAPESVPAYELSFGWMMSRATALYSDLKMNDTENARIAPTSAYTPTLQ